MSATLERVKACVERGQVSGSLHGLGRADQHGLVFEDLMSSLPAAILVEDYPDAVRGPSVLALHRLPDGNLAHAVWGLARDRYNLAVLITAYRPDPARWSADFLTRRRG